MKTIKVKHGDGVPKDYTGIVEFEDGEKIWFKDGNLHREDDPANVFSNAYERWLLDGKLVWGSTQKLDLTNKIILSKSQHPKYSRVQIWKILDKDEVYDLTVIPGMEKWIIE